jgi:hypothetical protein
MSRYIPVGYFISGLIRDSLVADNILDYDKACKFVEKLDKVFELSDFLVTYNGTQFDSKYNITSKELLVTKRQFN